MNLKENQPILEKIFGFLNSISFFTPTGLVLRAVLTVTPILTYLIFFILGNIQYLEGR